MTIRLKSLAFGRRGNDGWTTGPYSFSSSLTVLEGPNGAGKTPMLKGIAYCLGNPIQLPPEIVTRCAVVLLELENDSETILIERAIHLDFSASITRGSEKADFNNLKDFSSYIRNLFGIQERHFASRSADVSPLYMSFLVPMFWVDQDVGWSDLYCPLYTQNFLRDQFEEIVRLLMNVPGRNRAIDKNEYAAAIVRWEAAKQQVDIKRAVLESLEKSLLKLGPRISASDIEERKAAITSELRSKTAVLETLATESSAFDEEITARRVARDRAIFAHEAAKRRLEELRSYGKTLDAQVAIVETNEIAADAFRNLCGNKACEFFRDPEESYGRRVLYIKDQIKDFETSMSLLRQEGERLHTHVAETEALLRRSVEQKASQAKAASGDQIVMDIDRLTKELASVSSQLLLTQRYEAEAAEFEKLVNLTVTTEDIAKGLRPTRGASRDESMVWDMANELGSLFNSWLTTLNTPNLPKQIWFDEHFSLWLGGIRFTENAPFGGSTRTRIVLAFHAALLELSLKLGGCHPRMLVLDTPKQHELHPKDLKSFVTRFLTLQQTYSGTVQLVIAATELEFLQQDAEQEIWHPFFSVKGEARFFGRLLPGFESAYSDR